MRERKEEGRNGEKGGGLYQLLEHNVSVIECILCSLVFCKIIFIHIAYYLLDVLDIVEEELHGGSGTGV